METSRRRQIAVSHDLIAGLAKGDPADVGGPVHEVVADWLRDQLRRGLPSASRRQTPFCALDSHRPGVAARAARYCRGMARWLARRAILRVIQTFVRELPDAIPVDTVEKAERFLAQQATKLRPDQLEKAAHRCALRLNPDGKFSDADRARQRGFTWSGQRPDGMSIGKLVASPELRANLDAWLARFAAPGICNPDDQTPCFEREPSEESASRDLRSPAQRQHDALNTGCYLWHR